MHSQRAVFPCDRLARMTASALSLLAIEFNGTFIILACFVIPVLIL